MSRKGFSLIELMVSLVIIGTLAAVTYPTYLSYITKTRRTDAQITLVELAARMERYYLENNSYADATLSKLNMNNDTTHGFYVLSIAKTTPTTYLLMATPSGMQAKNDIACGTLTLNQLGQQGQTGTNKTTGCWY